MAYAFVTRIKEVKKHSNADRLQVGKCFGNQVIVSLDTKEDDLGIYFATDSQIGEEYCVSNDLLRRKDKNGNSVGGYLDPQKRNIRALKLRGEVSDGLFMPIKSLNNMFLDTQILLNEGDCIDTLNGVVIAQKYIPKTNKRNNTSKKSNNGRKEIKDMISFPLFEEHKDTKQYAYNKHAFQEGDLLTISLKMHGTSGRTGNLKELTKHKRTLFNRTLFKLGLKNETSEAFKTVSGTRRVVLKGFDGGYYGNDDFRKTYHDLFDGKLLKGETVYYEIVGYTGNDNQTIMSKCSNKKTKDKDFIKKYGDETVFSYGCDVGENDIYVYRMTMTNDDGDIVEYPTSLIKQRCEQMNVKAVPVFEQFFFTTIEDLEDKVNKYSDGVDEVGLTHIKEGCVIRIENRQSFVAYKHKNFHFKVLEGIIKDAGILDMEEQESIKVEE